MVTYSLGIQVGECSRTGYFENMVSLEDEFFDSVGEGEVFDPVNLIFRNPEFP